MLIQSIEECIGRTPLLSAARFAQVQGLAVRLLVKLECMNPAGSVKDRAAAAMIRRAEEAGLLPPKGTIIEPTSGNTGIGLAAVAAAKEYRVILTMPDSMSRERRMLLRAYGAELVLTPGAKGMQGAVEKAEELHESIPGSIIAGQFYNPANPRRHYETTGPEIWEDSGKHLDWFVAGVGTGGTISGAGRYLKEQDARVRVCAVEPAGSPLLSGGQAGSHGLQGLGANFVPKNFDRSVVDEILDITEEEAFASARAFARTEGFLVGISSGAALAAAKRLAQREDSPGKTIAVLCPDTGERYLSTSLFED